MTIFERIFPPKILYIRILKNKLEVKHIQSGRKVERTTTKPFSNEKHLIVHFDEADTLLRQILNEFFESRLIRIAHHTLIQVVDDTIKEITPVEQTVYYDLARFSGSSKIKIYPTQEILTDKEVLAYLYASE